MILGRTLVATLIIVGFLHAGSAQAGQRGLHELTPADFGADEGPLASLVEREGQLSERKLEKLKQAGVITGVQRAGPRYLELTLPQGSLYTALELFYSDDGGELLAVHALRDKQINTAGSGVSRPPEILRHDVPGRFGALGSAWGTDIPGLYLMEKHWFRPNLLWVLDEERFWPLTGTPMEIGDLDERILRALQAEAFEEAIALHEIHRLAAMNDTGIKMFCHELDSDAPLVELEARFEATEDLYERLSLVPELRSYQDVLERICEGYDEVRQEDLSERMIEQIEVLLQEQESRVGPAEFAAWVVLGVTLDDYVIGASSAYLKDQAPEDVKARLEPVVEKLVPSIDQASLAWVPGTIDLSTVAFAASSRARFGNFPDRFQGSLRLPVASDPRQADIQIVEFGAIDDSRLAREDVTTTELVQYERVGLGDTSARDAWVSRYNEVAFRCADELEALEASRMAIDDSGPSVRGVGLATATEWTHSDGTTTTTYEQEGIEFGRRPDNAAAITHNIELDAQITELEFRCADERETLGEEPVGAAARGGQAPIEVERTNTETRWSGRIAQTTTYRIGSETRTVTTELVAQDGTRPANGALERQAKEKIQDLAEEYAQRQFEAYLHELERKGQHREAGFTRWLFHTEDDVAIVAELFVASEALPTYSFPFQDVPSPTLAELFPDAAIFELRAQAE
jgi:hypothetical protein